MAPGVMVSWLQQELCAQSGVAVMTSLTPLTAEPVSGKTVHLISTVVAGVGSAQGGTQAEAHRYPNGVVIHT